MSMLWRGIVERENYSAPGSKRTSAFADLAYSHVSDNYRHAFQGDVACFAGDTLPVRYRELQLLADMISGMTDTYAVDLHKKLSKFHVGANYRDV
jgi:dGTPase